jgi:NADP-dependent 3-hydroxy acid dehydrogenase YdfG
MKSKMHFPGQVTVITGASRGIGRAIALAFAREGAITVLASRSLEELDRVADEIRSLNGTVRVVSTDVSSRQAVGALVDEVEREFGRIDTLINNAGGAVAGAITRDGFVEDIRQLLEVDLFGTVYCTTAVLPLMLRQRSGHIVNMSSVVGRKAFPGLAAYSISMHAVAAFSDALRQELYGSGITVSVIHPALAQTALFSRVDPADMPPPFRKMTPISAESVADAVVGAVRRRAERVVVPSPPSRLLLADAISARLGDRIVRLMSNPTFARLIGMYRGSTYRHRET